MVEDAYENQKNKSFDMSVLVTNDSDFTYALRVLQKLHQEVILVTPVTREYADKKRKTGDKYISTSLHKYVPRKNRILFIDGNIVKKHPLPKKI